MTEDRPHHPAVKLPPPLVYVIVFAIAWLLHWMWPIGLPGADPQPWHAAGVILVIAGVAMGAWGAITFKRAGTAVVPLNPATTLVEHGPYRFTRNPMYLGLATVYLGGAALLDSVWPVLLFPILIFAMRRLVIDHEERYLTAIFGDEYVAFTSRVRRWL